MIALSLSDVKKNIYTNLFYTVCTSCFEKKAFFSVLFFKRSGRSTSSWSLTGQFPGECRKRKVKYPACLLRNRTAKNVSWFSSCPEVWYLSF